MKIEIKNVQHAKFASQETECFEATVYIDGKKAGEARNEGHGGCNFYHPTSLGQQLETYAKTLPDDDVSAVFDDGEKHLMPMTADAVIDRLVMAYLTAREMRRTMAARILFTKEDGKVYETRRMDKVQMARHLADPAKAKATLKAVEILNLLPAERALALYAANVA